MLQVHFCWPTFLKGSLVFRVLAGSSIGLGHLSRCRNLAEVMLKRGWDIAWMLDSEAASYFCTLKLPGVCIRTADDCLADADLALIQTLENEGQRISAIIVDGYKFDSDYLQQLSRLGHVMILMDDGLLTGLLPIDLLINSSLAITADRYEGRNVGKTLLGSAYVPLSSVFSELSLTPRKSRNRAVVTFGGSDPAKLTRSFLLAAEQCAFFAGKTIDLITGVGNTDLMWINNWLKMSKLQISHLHNVANMAHVLAQARVAIASAGVTAHELVAAGVRPQLIVAAENQRENAKAMQRHGLCDLFEKELTLNWQRIFEACESSWYLADSEQHDIDCNQRFGCDGRGVFRIADEIENLVPKRHSRKSPLESGF